MCPPMTLVHADKLHHCSSLSFLFDFRVHSDSLSFSFLPPLNAPPHQTHADLHTHTLLHSLSTYVREGCRGAHFLRLFPFDTVCLLESNTGRLSVPVAHETTAPPSRAYTHEETSRMRLYACEYRLRAHGASDSRQRPPVTTWRGRRVRRVGNGSLVLRVAALPQSSRRGEERVLYVSFSLQCASVHQCGAERGERDTYMRIHKRTFDIKGQQIKQRRGRRRR